MMKAVIFLQQISRLIRSYGLDSDQFIVVLYLYFLRATDIEFEVIKRTAGNEFLSYDIQLSLPINDFPVIHRIHEIISKNFREWPEDSFYDLLKVSEFFNVDDKNVAPELFEDLIYAYDSNLGKGKSIGVLPEGLAQELFRYLELPDNSSVYNPFAGYASLSKRPYSGGKYVGQEIDEMTWAIGAMRLIINGYDFNPDFRKEDSISDWVESEKFDLVTAFPPFHLKIRRQYPDVRYAKTAEEFVLSRGLRSLKNNGKLMCVVSNGFLSSIGADKSYRREIVDNNLLDTVISFPNGLLSNTGIPFSVLIINKNKSSEKVWFHDINTKISDINNQRSSRNQSKVQREKVDWRDIFTGITKDPNNQYSLEVERDEISMNDYNLSVSRYFVFKGKADLLENARLLEEVAEIIPGNRIEGEKFGKFIRIRDLNDGGINFAVNLEDVEDSKVPNYAREISESCILVSARWNTLKPTLFNYTERPIYISQDIIALKPDNDIIDSGYLVNELQEEYVLEQFLKLQTGGTIPNLNKKDLLRIRIELPPINEQRAKVQGVFAAAAQSDREKVELQKELLGYKDEAFREFASIKHTFRQYLNALKSNASGTKKFLLKNEGKSITMDMLYSKNLNQSFGDHLEKIDDIIDALNQLLHVQESPSVTSEKMKIQHPVDLIKQAQRIFKKPEVFSFSEIFVDKPTFSEIGGISKCSINISKDDFYQIFSNIVTNAERHGFKNSSAGNIIRTDLSADNEYLLMEISNNGLPLENGMSLKRIITRGEKTSDSEGLGIGGSDINKIMKFYGGEFDIKNDPESQFPVKYVLKFPLLETIATF